VVLDNPDGYSSRKRWRRCFVCIHGSKNIPLYLTCRAGQAKRVDKISGGEVEKFLT
jgi:hypothetical protein